MSKRIKVKVKDAPESIYIERQIHDEAVVISGYMTIRSNAFDPNALIAGEIEAAAREIKKLGGVVGHIKVSVSKTSTSMISVTDEEAMVKGSPTCRVRISLAAIAFLIDPPKAEDIIRKTLKTIQAIQKSE